MKRKQVHAANVPRVDLKVLEELKPACVQLFCNMFHARGATRSTTACGHQAVLQRHSTTSIRLTTKSRLAHVIRDVRVRGTMTSKMV